MMCEERTKHEEPGGGGHLALKDKSYMYCLTRVTNIIFYPMPPRLLCMINLPPSWEGECVIEGLDRRIIDRDQIRSFTYATINCPAVPAFWSHCHHACSVEDSLPQPSGVEEFRVHVFPRKDRLKWGKVPQTEVTIIYHQLGEDPFGEDHWILQMFAARPPSTLLVFIDRGEVVFSEGYRRKIKQIVHEGFWTVTWNVCESEVGAACRQSFTITFCGRSTLLKPLGVETLYKYQHQPARSSDNHLIHYKLGRRSFRPSSEVIRTVQQGHLWCGHLDNDPVYGPGTCLPCTRHQWVETAKGCRRMQFSEWRSIKGYTDDTSPSSLDVLLAAPSQQLWSTLGDMILGILSSTNGSKVEIFTRVPNKAVESVCTVESPKELQWRPPSFKKRGKWYRKRVANLRAACSQMSEEMRQRWFDDGLRRLELHRHNYGEEGPKHLVLLWWEWPEECQAELRDGLSMNFLSTPPAGIKPNAPMNAEELATAVKFVDELCALGVLEREPYPGNVVNTCPLFLVPKPGQPGQYRCIADMKKGGQNACVGADPVQMTSPHDILPRLYHGGYSATLDIAKYFHMFPTVEAERPYLGCIHPSTGDMWRYGTLPMGAGNSPGASARYGMVFVRLVTTTLPAFQGEPIRNDYASGFSGQGFDPKLGVGRILIGPDGLPACLIWIHVDDLLIHGPTFDKCTAGLHQLLDLSVRLGFICQRVKTVPPCRCVKYCGFIYDTHGIPTMRIPTDKISRALSQVAYVRRPDVVLSRMGLAITVGNLQSLVPATPNSIGASFLRHLYSNLHATNGRSYTSHLDFYYEAIPLTDLSTLDLQWWSQALVAGLESQCVTRYSAHLGVAWGDGSGSGTGGTFEWVAPDKGPLPTMCTWLGTWSPSVHHFSSNWRELRTLVATLDPTEQGLQDITDVHLFYFTDNSTVYHVSRSGSSSSPQLHLLVQRLKLLEITRKCRLDVIHVPGTAMIQQGTDGQSRGLWVSPLGCSQRNITADLFRPAPPSDALLEWIVRQLPVSTSSGDYCWITDDSSWLATSLVHRHCVWSLSPTTARQGFLAAVFAWIESPQDSSHAFLVPRLLQREYGRVNKHILFLGQFIDVPLPSDFSPLVPFVLYYLPPFVRSVKRLDDQFRVVDGSQRSCPEWVRSQMEYLRGLSGTSPAK